MTGKQSDPTALARRLIPGAPPSGQSPLHGGDPGPCGEFDIRIAQDGTWFYHGSPITRKPLVKLFASVLRRDSVGDYWLQTPVEKGKITVDDAPFVAVELSVTGSGRDQELTFRTNLDDNVTAGPDHHIRVITDMVTRTPRPYILVRDGLEALIARPVFYQLVDLGTEDDLGTQDEEMGKMRDSGGARGVRFGVWSRGVFFPLGQLE
jgi:hypothetical protein